MRKQGLGYMYQENICHSPNPMLKSNSSPSKWGQGGGIGKHVNPTCTSVVVYRCKQNVPQKHIIIESCLNSQKTPTSASSGEVYSSAPGSYLNLLPPNDQCVALVQRCQLTCLVSCPFANTSKQRRSGRTTNTSPICGHIQL